MKWPQYTNDCLSHLSQACGAPSKATKAAKIASIDASVRFFRSIPPIPKVLAIDVGIKNFSYCQLTAASVADYNFVSHRPRVDFAAWSTDDLTTKYGGFPEEDNDLAALAHAKRYFNGLAYNVLEELVFSRPVDQQPDVILIETQRTRSNNATSTLPIVLRNYTFENSLYSTYHTMARALPSKVNPRCHLIPMSAPRMSNFFLNRFLVKAEAKSKYAKPNRLHLVLDWLNHPERSPVDVRWDVAGLPTKDGSVYDKTVLQYFNTVHHRQLTKLDDLFDSLLYALGFLINHRANLLVSQFIDHDYDLNRLAKALNIHQLKLIQGLVNARGLSLNPAYRELFDDIDSYDIAGYDLHTLSALA